MRKHTRRSRRLLWLLPAFANRPATTNAQDEKIDLPTIQYRERDQKRPRKPLPEPRPAGRGGL